MRRDEEENLRRLEHEYKRCLKALEEAQNRLNELQNRLSERDETIRNAGLSIEKGVVRWAENPSDMYIAPTYEAERLAQTRSYEVKTRMADIDGIGIDGIRAVIHAYNEIEANKPMPTTLENQLRKLQEEIERAARFMIANHAGYVNPNAGYSSGWI